MEYLCLDIESMIDCDVVEGSAIFDSIHLQNHNDISYNQLYDVIDCDWHEEKCVLKTSIFSVIKMALASFVKSINILV